LRDAEFLVASEFLDRHDACAAHRQVRTEAVSQDVNPPLVRAYPSRRAWRTVLHDLTRERLAVFLARHSWTPQVPVVA
jgi:hypothetical protein